MLRPNPWRLFGFKYSTPRPKLGRSQPKLRCDALEDRVTPTVYTVNALTDTGTGSGLAGDLRYCIQQSNTDGQADTINFASSLTAGGSATIYLQDQLVLNNALGTVINGPGASLLALDGLGNGLTVSGLATLNGLTLTDGSGIVNSGNLTLNNFTVNDNSAAYGGGINNSGTLTVTNSVISNNSASDSGGGIYNNGGY